MSSAEIFQTLLRLALGLDPEFFFPFVSAHPQRLYDNMSGKFYPPVAAQIDSKDEVLTSLELQDGTVFQGYSFGAKKSVAGELVFQTGMVGYPESITDPSYRGQILVMTFPLVGNYGVPSRETMDELLKDLPAHFESSEIHIAGLVTASYSGEEFSHFLATSSLGTWLKEQGVPAMYGVDTRVLTKRIREHGSMLGRMLLQRSDLTNGFSDGLSHGLTNGLSDGLTNGISHARTNGLSSSRTDGLSNALTNGLTNGHTDVPSKHWSSSFEQLDWVNPNEKNLVADGESILIWPPDQTLTPWYSLDPKTQIVHSEAVDYSEAPFWQAHTRFVRGCRIEIQSIALPAQTRHGSLGLPLGL